MISSPIKGQPLPLCVRLPHNKCLWPLLLPEDFQLRGSLKISLILGKIVECFLYHLEREKHSSKGNIQANFPFPCASLGRLEVAEEWICLHVVKTHLCLLSQFHCCRMHMFSQLLPSSAHPVPSAQGGARNGGVGGASASLPGLELACAVSSSTAAKRSLLVDESYFP